MNVEYTGRHYEVTSTNRKDVEAGLSKIRKILRDRFDTKVILAIEKHRHIAEITINSRVGPLVGVAQAKDMAAAIGEALDHLLGGRWVIMRMEPECRRRLIYRQLRLPLLARRDDPMGSPIGCSRDHQSMPMHGDVFTDAIADLRDYLLAPPHPHGWPEIGSVDAVSCRIVVILKPNRTGPCIERYRPFGIPSELGRDWQGRPRAILRTGPVRADSCDYGSGNAPAKHCSP